MSTPTIRERPILFSGPMVRAVLAGRKTQTRRVLNPQPANPRSWQPVDGPPQSDFVNAVGCGTGNPRLACPHGRQGDRLWVREAFTLTQHGKPVYRADARDGSGERWSSITPGDPAGEVRWTSSIHMPRRYSRITLEITGVRIERLNDITDADAKAEGLLEWTDPPRIPSRHYGLSVADVWESDPRQAFARIWDQINGKRPGCSWADNPWVWALTFRRVGMEGE